MAKRVDNRDYEQELNSFKNYEATFEFDMYSELNKQRLRFEEQLFDAKNNLLKKEAKVAAALHLKTTAQDLKSYEKELKGKYKLEKKYQELSAKERNKKIKEEAKVRIESEKKIAKEIAAFLGTTPKSAAQELHGSLVSKASQGPIGKQLLTMKRMIGSDNPALKTAGWDALGKAVSGIAKGLETTIDQIGLKKGVIDTRLQGSKNFRSLSGLSYWDAMSSNITRVAGMSPYIKQSAVADNVQSMVTSGIAFNVEQRAFLQTIKTKIADTFDATNGTLLRLIRIQQQDSTAARLGMESSLNAFLNNMYENTEYLKQVSDGVKSSLEEAMSLMSAVDAVGFEYQVQKWMGSLYSVGMSQSGVNSIAQALGQISAGDISGLNGTGAGNLLVMAANNAGISLADILATGLDESSTNSLMKAMVEYLSVIANETSGSRVVQQQLAKVYGLSASDLKAASGLRGNIGAISKNGSNYNQSMLRLYGMAGTMTTRTGMGELLGNMQENLNYTMAAGIANNPALYALYKAAGLLDMFGGIQLPAFSVMGNMVDLETNVADLMRAGALGGGILSGIGKMATGLGGGFSGMGMLASLGILPGIISTVHRGNGGFGLSASGISVARSGYVGNESSEDVKEKTLDDANSDADKQMVEKQDEQEEDIKLKAVNESVLRIYELLQDVTSGGQAFHTVSDIYR